MQFTDIVSDIEDLVLLVMFLIYVGIHDRKK